MQNRRLCTESHDMYLCRNSVRLEAVRLNGIDKSKSGLVNDFPPDPPSADQML
jgi:hypothetical protein